MKVFTPEISWHQKEPVFSVDFCKATWRLASGGADFTVKIWNVKEDSQGNIGLDFMANLDRHSKPVNVVRFSSDGKLLASAGDDCIIIIWKLAEDGEQKSHETMIGAEEICNKETWTVYKMLRRGHLEDIYDLAWSPDGQQLISGSVDNSAIIWDVNKGQFTNIIKDHKHYVQGVCWDPRGQYVATHSSDRTCKVYSLTKNRCIKSIDRATFPIENPAEDEPKSKTCKLFMDETMQSFFRRCTFSPDGLLLVLPGGLNHSGQKPVKATYVFTRGNLNKPALCLPGPKKATVGVCFCPIAFENMENDAAKENGSTNEDIFRLPYRLCYAVATLDSVIFYDTQHHYPFGFVSGVHYASLTDMTWSSDGRVLVVSSLDGYCSFITFKDGELGKPVTFDPMEFVKNKMKARKEARKEAKTVQATEGPSPAVPVSDKDQSASGQKPSGHKDQPTLHQFITPVRKRKRPSANGSSSSPSNAGSGMTGNGSQGSPYDLTNPQKDQPMADVQVQSRESLREDNTLVKTPVHHSTNGTTPRRANLFTLGFQPIPKSPKTPTGKETATSDCAMNPSERPQTDAPQPRRVSLTTLSANSAGTSPSHQASAGVDAKPLATPPPSKRLDGMMKSPTAGSPSSKPPQRVPFTSLSVKRDHAGATKTCGPSDAPSTQLPSVSGEIESVAVLSHGTAIPDTSSKGTVSAATAPAGTVSSSGTAMAGSSPLKSSPKQVRRVNFVTLSSPKSGTDASSDPRPMKEVPSKHNNGAHSPMPTNAVRSPRRVALIPLPSVEENSPDRPKTNKSSDLQVTESNYPEVKTAVNIARTDEHVSAPRQDASQPKEVTEQAGDARGDTVGKKEVRRIPFITLS